MMRRLRRGWSGCLIIVCCWLPAVARTGCAADDNSGLLPRLPSGALAAAEISGLESTLQQIKTSELLENILGSDPYREFAKSPQFQQVQTGRNFVEAFLGMSLWDAGQKLLGHRLAVAVYPNPDGSQPHGFGVLKVADSKTLDEFRKRIEPFLSEVTAPDAPGGKASIRVYSVNNKAFVAFHDEWVVGSDTRELLNTTLKLLAAEGPGEDVLGAMPGYQAMLRHMGADHFVQAFVNLQLVRKAYALSIPRKLDNPLGSLLFGGIVELAATSDYLGMSVDHDKHGFRIRWGLDGGPSTVPAAHRPFFSDPKSAGTGSLPELDGLIGGFAVHRDFAGWYQAREHLVEPELLPEFDKFETGLGNFLPGRDFGEDVLPLLGSQVVLIAAPQTYEHLDGRPGVQLPGFAMIVDLQDPQAGGDLFSLFFQTLMAILNIEAGQQGRQPWIVASESYNGAQIAFARYLKRPVGQRLPIVFNFTPSATRIGKRFVICTSRDLCRKLVDHLQKPASDTSRENRNFAFELRGASVAKALEANHELLTAESLKEGKTLQQANRDMQYIFDLIRRIDHVRLSTHVRPRAFQLELEGRWR